MNVTINILELASELASAELESLFEESGISIYNEENDEFVYTEEAKEVFLELYDKYYTIIDQLKQ